MQVVGTFLLDADDFRNQQNCKTNGFYMITNNATVYVLFYDCIDEEGKALAKR
jgi:hypothetical protein